MASFRSPLPPDPLFPPVASDWLTADKSPDVVFREGKWWNRVHWIFWRRDRRQDQRKRDRNLGIRRFLNSQPNSFK